MERQTDRQKDRHTDRPRTTLIQKQERKDGKTDRQTH